MLGDRRQFAWAGKATISGCVEITNGNPQAGQFGQLLNILNFLPCQFNSLFGNSANRVCREDLAQRALAVFKEQPPARSQPAGGADFHASLDL